MQYAHSLPGRPKDEWQTLEEHLSNVAEIASQFSSVFGAPLVGNILGIMHDVGKNSAEFQRRLEGGRRVDHATAGARYLLEEWGGAHRQHKEGEVLARLLGYALLGHHGGMPDYGRSAADEGSLQYRLSAVRNQELPDWRQGLLPPVPPFAAAIREILPLMSGSEDKFDAFATGMLIRMLYSCLVDADFLDTERFCSPDRHRLRPVWPAVSALEERLESRLKESGFLSSIILGPEDLRFYEQGGAGRKREGIDLARRYILQCCREAAQVDPGIFELTVPTGGGKTLSSLAFALRHAQKHGLARIIFVVPYTSIIEQNAQVFRKVLGEDAVLEHHCNYSYPEEDGEGEGRALQYRLSTENWDATVIVTTSVQFFESLFAAGPARCRKLHNIARSVIVLDEVQTIPVSYTSPCVAALKVLARHYHASVVLCTATQPALHRSAICPEGFESAEVRSIIPEEISSLLFSLFRRVELTRQVFCSDEELIRRLQEESQVLCIVNSRLYARELFTLLQDGEAAFHLSTYMTPAHRSRVLEAIRHRLEEGRPCRVISTSLIECGVDISFPVVLREKNGLDVLAQAAGRCNRHGEMGSGQVVVFDSGKPLPKRAAELARRRAAFDSVAEDKELFRPSCMERYFRALYQASSLDEACILKTMQQENRREFGVFQFASIDRTFQFIDGQTETVVIENTESEALVRELKSAPFASPDLLRRLQRFSVQVYVHELNTMQRDGRIETWHGCVHVLSGGVGYDEKLGLDTTLKDGVAVESLLF